MQQEEISCITNAYEAFKLIKSKREQFISAAYRQLIADEKCPEFIYMITSLVLPYCSIKCNKVNCSHKKNMDLHCNGSMIKCPTIYMDYCSEQYRIDRNGKVKLETVILDKQYAIQIATDDNFYKEQYAELSKKMAACEFGSHEYEDALYMFTGMQNTRELALYQMNNNNNKKHHEVNNDIR